LTLLKEKIRSLEILIAQKSIVNKVFALENKGFWQFNKINFLS